jgi:hypothetical protein
MEPAVAVLFMSGVILTIVGSGRAVVSRVGRGVESGTRPIPIQERPDVVRLVWLAVAMYGLFLASAGVIFGR